MSIISQTLQSICLSSPIYMHIMELRSHFLFSLLLANHVGSRLYPKKMYIIIFFRKRRCYAFSSICNVRIPLLTPYHFVVSARNYVGICLRKHICDATSVGFGRDNLVEI